MVELKFETKEYHLVDYRDLERFVDEEFGTTNWSFVATQEANNDSYYVFTALYAPSVTTEEVKEWRADLQKNIDEGWGSACDIFDVLVQEHRIPEGRYLVDVMW